MQHLRGHLPDRRHHARRSQLRGPRRRVQRLHGLHLALPDRVDRQLAQDAAGARLFDRRAAHVGRVAGRTAGRSARGRTRHGARRCRGAGATQRAAAGERGGRAGLQLRAVRRHHAALVGGACVHQPASAEEPDHRHRGRQLQLHRGGLREPDAPHRARLRHHALPGAGGTVDRHRAAGRGCQRQAALRAPVLHRESAKRRAAGLQQRIAHRQARARGSPGPAGPRRCQQLRLRPEGRGQGAGGRTLRRVLPDAQPPEVAHRHDLHRHRQRTDARDDRMAAAPAQERQVRRRQADALLRRAHAAGAAVLRSAADLAQGFHRHQLRVLAHARRAEALCAGRDARTRGRPDRDAEGQSRALLCVRPEEHGRRRGARASRCRCRRRSRLGFDRRCAQARRPPASRNLLDEVRRLLPGPGHRGRALPRDRRRGAAVRQGLRPAVVPCRSCLGGGRPLRRAHRERLAHRCDGHAAGHRRGAGRLGVLRIAGAGPYPLAEPGAAGRCVDADRGGARGAALREAADARHPALALAHVEPARAPGAGAGSDQLVQASGRRLTDPGGPKPRRPCSRRSSAPGGWYCRCAFLG
ncbi:hypothetical protein VARIO8X_160069 [Burkholderiales bacterium 8X]|nr:hypothetical protein VARIO8X_160069 [Burkholderiales bacterium 8X]